MSDENLRQRERFQNRRKLFSLDLNSPFSLHGQKRAKVYNELLRIICCSLLNVSRSWPTRRRYFVSAGVFVSRIHFAGSVHRPFLSFSLLIGKD